MPRFDLDHDHDDFDDQDRDEPITPDESPPYVGHPPVSGRAIASLVFSVMFCIPMLPSFLATLFGIFSLREIRQGRRSGRGLGLSGLILGVLGVAGWLFLGAISFLIYEIYTTQTSAAKDVATEFVRELSQGKLKDALARTIENTPEEPLESAARAMGDWGRFERLKKIDVRPLESKKGGEFHFELEGRGVFAKRDQDVLLRLIFDGSTYRVEQFKIGGKWAIGGGMWGK